MPTLEGTSSWNASVGKCRRWYCCHCSVAKLCSTLWEPMDCSPPGSSVHVIFQARLLKWLPFSSPGDLPEPGIKPASPVSPALVGGLSPQKVIYTIINFKKEHEGTETKARNVLSVTICLGILTDHFSWVLTVSGLFSKISLASSLLHSSSMHSLSRLPFFVSSSNVFARRLLIRTCEACCLDKTEGKKYVYMNKSFISPPKIFFKRENLNHFLSVNCMAFKVVLNWGGGECRYICPLVNNPKSSLVYSYSTCLMICTKYSTLCLRSNITNENSTFTSLWQCWEKHHAEMIVKSHSHRIFRVTNFLSFNGKLVWSLRNVGVQFNQLFERYLIG